MACPGCGAPQFDGAYAGVLTTGRPKERMVAVILAFVLGGFGAHRFYVGNIGLGILYLLFFWTFIPALVALVEAIVWLTMSEGDWQTKYSGQRA